MGAVAPQWWRPRTGPCSRLIVASSPTQRPEVSRPRSVPELAMDEPRFVADSMLGRLARWLRALGYDTLYFRDAPDRRLLAVALRERRRLLTRDVALARRARDAGLLVRAEALDDQIHEVMAASGVAGRRLLSRCLECNGLLAATDPADVRDRVPPYTFATRREFWTCTGCDRVFWEGTHVAGIRRRLELYLGDG
jgi:uncharacterized protein